MKKTDELDRFYVWTNPFNYLPVLAIAIVGIAFLLLVTGCNSNNRDYYDGRAADAAAQSAHNHSYHCDEAVKLTQCTDYPGYRNSDEQRRWYICPKGHIVMVDRVVGWIADNECLYVVKNVNMPDVKDVIVMKHEAIR